MNLEGEVSFWFSGWQLEGKLQETTKKKFMWTTENEAQNKVFLTWEWVADGNQWSTKSPDTSAGSGHKFWVQAGPPTAQPWPWI